MNLLYEGKAKRVYEVDHGDKVVIEFKDSLTAFNAEKRDEVKGKGALACDISVRLFRVLEAKGVKTHFLGRLSETSILARKLRIIPLEVIVRFVAAGSLVRRYGVEKGKALEPPVVEFSLKSDELGDPLLCPSHIVSLGLATLERVRQLEEEALRAARVLRELFEERGLTLVDIKFEFGEDSEGNIYLADEISPDTMRLWLGKESLDKDVFREDKGDVLAAYKEVRRRLHDLPG